MYIGALLPPSAKRLPDDLRVGHLDSARGRFPPLNPITTHRKQPWLWRHAVFPPALHAAELADALDTRPTGRRHLIAAGSASLMAAAVFRLLRTWGVPVLLYGSHLHPSACCSSATPLCMP